MLGNGTTFKIYLPHATGEISRPTANAKEEREFKGCETILIVEDEESVRALAGRILREQGYTVLEARDGAEVLHIAREFAGDIQLVLTDVVMPGMSGKTMVSRLETTRPISRHFIFRTTPIALLSTTACWIQTSPFFKSHLPSRA